MLYRKEYSLGKSELFWTYGMVCILAQIHSHFAERKVRTLEGLRVNAVNMVVLARHFRLMGL